MMFGDRMDAETSQRVPLLLRANLIQLLGFSCTVKEYLTLQSRFAIFEPWILSQPAPGGYRLKRDCFS